MAWRFDEDGLRNLLTARITLEFLKVYLKRSDTLGAKFDDFGVIAGMSYKNLDQQLPSIAFDIKVWYDFD